MRDLHLKEVEINSFAGIDTESPVVIHWTEAKKNQGITMLRGDQETGKTSTLNAIMSLMGAVFNFETKTFINKKNDTIDTSLKFTYEGADYEASQSGSRVMLKRFFKEAAGGKGKWIAEGSPKETLRIIFGNLGISPMFLKSLPGKKQIQWFKETFGVTEEVSKKEQKLQTSLDTIFKQRTELNREIKEDDAALKANPLFKNYEKNHAKFAKAVTADKEWSNLETLRVKKEDFEKNKQRLESLKEARDKHNTRIQELQQQLDTEVSARSTVEKRIADGEAYIKASNGIEKEFSAANEAYLNISKTIAEQTQWNDLLKKEKRLQASEEAVVLATDQIDQLRAAILELTSTYLPKIKELEIRTKGMSIDNGDEDEGIFYQGKSLAQLSESELSALFLMIWEAKKVEFVFIENISSYGSGFVKLLNDLVKAGKIKVMASEMDRAKKEMQISFEAKII